MTNAHRAHYSIQRNEHDHNLGAVLFLWGRLFRTLAELESAKTDIKGDLPQTFIKLVKLGFTMANTQTEHAINLEAMIRRSGLLQSGKTQLLSGP